MTRRNVKVIGWLLVGVAYLLALATQLPHIYDVYASLERGHYALFGVSTALGAALAFEASVAIFTLRVIVNTKTERSRWTRIGIVAFLCVSAIANVSYYFDVAALDDVAMPLILAVALPFALWIYAEEFGRGARAQAKRTVTEQPTQPEPDKPHKCAICGAAFAKQQGLAAHMRRHKQ